MDSRIDAYMLITDEPANWVAAAVASISHPGIRLQIVKTSKAIPVGEDWTRCIVQVGSDLITFVDPDNLYDPEAFMVLADALDAQPRAVLGYTDEVITNEDGGPLGIRRHAYNRVIHHQRADHVHSCVTYRRHAALNVIDALSGITRYPDWALSLSLTQTGQVLHLPLLGRQWRQHPGQAHRIADPDEARRIRSFSRRAFNAIN
jgi:hypothetical protein